MRPPRARDSIGDGEEIAFAFTVERFGVAAIGARRYDAHFCRKRLFSHLHTCCCLQIMLLGDSTVGKTCLCIRIKDGKFLAANNFIATVGVDYRSTLLTVDGQKVKIQVFDTAGQERFRSLTSAYYRDADALLLVFDITNRTSFENTRVCSKSKKQENGGKSQFLELAGASS